MKAILDDDLVVGLADDPTLSAPKPLAGVPLERQRWDGYALIDVAAVTDWHIDGVGRKRLAAGAGRQALTCAWDDDLVDDAGTWRVSAAADRLAAGKAQGKTSLAVLAEQRRQRYITPGDGKAAIYSVKAREAAAWQVIVDASGTPVPADFPWIKARGDRIAVRDSAAADYQAVADEWNAKASAWEAVGRAIEDAYEGAIDAIDALTDGATVAEDVAAIVSSVSWP